MADYWSREEGKICLAHEIDWAETGDTSVVCGYGVKSYSTDADNKLRVMLASANAGWGIALETQATASEPVSVLLHGLIKVKLGSAVTGGGTGATRNYALSFGSAGLLGNMTAGYTTGPTAQKVAWALQSGAADDETLVYFTG